MTYESESQKLELILRKSKPARLSDPATLRGIATQLRPAIIFDSRNRILADQGGLLFVRSVKAIPGNGSIPTEVVVHPRAFLAVAPLLESLDEPGLNIEAVRGEGLQWRYTLHGGGMFESGAKNPRFRLEILR